MSATKDSSSKRARQLPAVLPAMILALIVITAVATGVGLLTSSGARGYGCMALTHQGSQVEVKTTGLVHYIDGEFYVSCNEGSDLPSSSLTFSCLLVSPHEIPATIGVGAPTYYYYLSTSGGQAITLHGAPPPTNGTEIIDPSSISITAAC